MITSKLCYLNFIDNDNKSKKIKFLLHNFIRLGSIFFSNSCIN